MKIITEGSLPEKKFYTVTCRHCKTKFEFARSEAKYISDQRDGGFLQIKCPLTGCNRHVTTSP